MQKHSESARDTPKKEGIASTFLLKLHLIVSSCLRYLFAEWDEGEDGHLEVLEAERDADYGKTADEAETDVEEGNLQSAEKNPDYIHYD